MIVLDCTTREEAQSIVDALGKSALYTRDGRPPLPRCDSAKWGDPEIRQGRHCTAQCPCETREQPDPSCPYATFRAADVVELERGFAVAVSSEHLEADGERVDVDGAEVLLAFAAARELTEAEKETVTVSRDAKAEAEEVVR